MKGYKEWLAKHKSEKDVPCIYLLKEDFTENAWADYCEKLEIDPACAQIKINIASAEGIK